MMTTCLGHFFKILWISIGKDHTCNQIGISTNCSHHPPLDLHSMQSFHCAFPVSYLFHFLEWLPQPSPFFIFFLHFQQISAPPPSQRQYKSSDRNSFSLLSIKMEEIPHLPSKNIEFHALLLSRGLCCLIYYAPSSLFIPTLSLPLVLSHQHLKFYLSPHSKYPPSTLTLYSYWLDSLYVCIPLPPTHSSTFVNLVFALTTP